MSFEYVIRSGGTYLNRNVRIRVRKTTYVVFGEDVEMTPRFETAEAAAAAIETFPPSVKCVVVSVPKRPVTMVPAPVIESVARCRKALAKIDPAANVEVHVLGASSGRLVWYICAQSTVLRRPPSRAWKVAGLSTSIECAAVLFLDALADSVRAKEGRDARRRSKKTAP